MDPEYEEYLGHPVFFARGLASPTAAERFDVVLPTGWAVVVDEEWTYALPHQRSVRAQGWKVHASATLDHAEATLAAIALTCVELRVTFKFLSTKDRLFWRNSKTCSREHAGKFVTCYPEPEQLENFLAVLEGRLSSFAGPYILSDRRWANAPVYLRYGAFKFRSLSDTSPDVSALTTPSGELVADLRQAYFATPPWAEIPPFLASWLESSQGAVESDQEMPFVISSAIKFSNSGGTYRGIMSDESSTPVIVKEGRPHAGLDLDFYDAVHRLQAEAEALAALKGVESVPTLKWEGHVWEHSFIAIEQLQGVPLNRWVTANAPGYTRDSPTATDYFQSAGRILSSLRSVVDGIHGRGWAHQDIHPDNILVDETNGLRVSLIDFETAVPTSVETRRQVMGAPGFRSRRMRTPQSLDWFGVRQVGSFLVAPLVTQTELVDDYSLQVRRFASARYGGTAVSTTSIALASLLEQLDELDALLADDASGPDKTRHPFSMTSWTPSSRDEEQVDVRKSWMERIDRGLDLVREATVPGRMFPVHIYGLGGENTGLAFGDLSIAAMRYANKPNRPSALLGIPDSVPKNSFALFTGAMGDMLAMQSLGETEAVRDFVRSNQVELLHQGGNRIYDGLPGVLLGMLRLGASFDDEDERATIRANVLRTVRAVARDYAADPESFGPIGMDRPSASNSPTAQDSGLLYGHLGVAWLFVEAHRLDRSGSFLDHANEAMVNELKSYTLDERYGTMQLVQGHRQLPYLSMGSAGFGVVLSKLGRGDVVDEVTEAAPHLLKATEASVCVYPGLFNGYSGLALGNAGLRAFLGMPPADSSDICDVLSAFAIASGPAALFAGDSGLRLTADLASGSAGILLGLACLREGNYDPLSQFELRPAYRGSTELIGMR